jgi:group I intron endonuclease
MATAKLTSTRQYADEFSAREKVCGIYMITCVVNKKYYIGSSKNMRHRWLSHCHDLRKMKHSNLHLQRAYDLYGLREFRFTVLEYCPAEALLLREQFYIDIFDATNEQIGFNKAKVAGNPSKGTRRSVDASEKTAKYRRKVWQFVDPLGNPVTVTNLPAFCKENKLSQKSMACVGNGTTLKSYKGWRKLSDATRHTIHTKYKPCYDGEDRKSEFSLVDPMGITHTFKGIKASARRLGLGERGFHRVIQGKQEHHRG